MCGKQHVLAVISAAVFALITVAAIAGCSSGTTSSAGNGSGTSTPIASSSAVVKAKEQATACISKTGLSGLISSSGRTTLVNCLKGIVPPAERQAFQECLTSAALNDKVWTTDGRTKFTDTSVPDCVNQVSVATPAGSP